MEPDAATAPLTLRSSLRADFADSTWPQRVLLVATALWLAYEWGFGNETLTPWLLVNVIDDTSGNTTIVATAVVGFGFTALQQLASGFTAAAGFAMFGRTSRAAWRMLRARLGADPTSWAHRTVVTRALVVFALGTTAVVLIEMTLTGEVGARRHRRTIVGAATLCGLMVGVIGAVGGGAVVLGRRRPELEPATNRVLAVLGSPLLWIGLLLVVTAAAALRRRVALRRV